ncbi:ATP-dependent DNA helicase [Pseudoalteromonas denitrificans]|uniref:Helicase, putative, RecD/TraA family n=1 Tax=Pseudoalteromonas denitrificans DSM 6059 TaxID=1123010 RepID=A0A1I1IKZ0_9GAMM|nr:ATP-dependent RecD-like DNA helicase [Pseudoalteromonas denitrificans]SFC36954.1 helicase, putative, RecD/TraA family [Pseudoalteromonas denitrificans DSM 6059]
MRQATGTVTKLVFNSEKRQIFRLKTVGTSFRVLLDDADQRVEIGEHVTIDGALVVHHEFGEQFHAEQITHTHVTYDLIADFLMQGSGIGKSIADRVLRAFPNDLVEKLEHRDIDALCAIDRISRASATVIVNQWHQQSGKAELISFIEGVLSNAKVIDRKHIKQAALKAYGFYKDETVAKLNDDPFRLWAFSTFKHAETFASAMNIPDDDERRLICAVEESIYRKLKDGSTQVYPLEFQEELKKLVGSKLSIKGIIAANNAASISPPRIIIKHSELNPVGSWAREMQEESPHKHLYNQTYALAGVAIMEQYVQEQLRLRIEQHIENINVSDDEISAYQLPSGHHLNKDQQLALRTVLTSTVSVISGGAGTGKTSVLYAVNHIIKAAGQHVLQVALAGKAAQRLIQQTDDDAFTIATLLNKMARDKAFLDDYDIPVFHIDEASMVDLQTMYRVLKAFERKPIRLVFIGDWAQLAPIGIGLVFHTLRNSNKISLVELKHNYRSKGGIVDVSEKIKKGELFTCNHEVEIIEYHDNQNVLDIVRDTYINNMTKNGNVYVIAARKKTVAESNIMLHKLLRKRDTVIKAAPEFRVNDEVIYKRNDEQLGLVNGSTGRIVSGETILQQSYTPEFADLVIDFELEGLKALETVDIKDVNKGEYYLQHAYAITCHSAQGSEFETAIIVVENSKLVERSWLYTAITRAKTKAILIVKAGQTQEILDRGFAFEKINSGLSV